ncbi:MAG: hypothetical protein HOE90_07145 [Bacteriovoracaceae bacterium]|jgi:hypothetical protein|nr:hypothetical protein [Bacteriovoracaceae bacterium]
MPYHSFKRAMVLSILSISTLSQVATADVIGSFSETTNHPGYVTTNKNSGQYKPVVLPKHYRGDGLEYGSPSQIIKGYIKDGQVNSDKINQVIKGLDYYVSQNMLLECQMDILKDYIKKGKTSKELAKDYDKIGNKVCTKYPIKEESVVQGFYTKYKKSRVFVTAEIAKDRLEKAKSYGISIAMNDQGLNSSKGLLFVENLIEGLEINEAIRVEQLDKGLEKGAVSKISQTIKNLLRKYTIKKGRPEASNLLIPSRLLSKYPGRKYFSSDELSTEKVKKQLKRVGKDVSSLTPGNTGLWRSPKTPIGEYNTANHNNGEPIGTLLNHMSRPEAEALLNPEVEISAVYKKSKHVNGTSPKMAVMISGQKFKLKFITNKLKAPPHMSILETFERFMMHGMEVNVEPVTNNIAAALGFTVDPVHFQKSIRLYLPGSDFNKSYEKFIEKMKEDFDPGLSIESAFEDGQWPDGTARKVIHFDKKLQKNYLLLRNVTLEKKSDKLSDRNIGHFAKTSFGRSLKRDHRAMGLFLAWIEDKDVKDGNAKVKYIPGKDPENYSDYKIAYSASDIGSGIGMGFPNLYSKEFVKSHKVDRNGDVKKITLGFHSAYPVDILDAVTLDDAKWFASLIMQLSPRQIYTAMREGGRYPKVIALTLTETMLKRRDDLVKALGLVGTTFTNEFGQTIKYELTSQINEENVENYVLTGRSKTGIIYDPSESLDLSKYFKFGLLTDPDNSIYSSEDDIFLRYWGSSMHFGKNIDEKSAIEFKASLTKGLWNDLISLVGPVISDEVQLTNAGIEIDGSDLNLIPFCGGEKCFFQGAKVGVEGFIPFRYYTKNPFFNEEDPKSNKYWVVDVFRMAFVLGTPSATMDEIFGDSDLGIVGDNSLFSAQGTVGFEWVKIRGVRNYIEAKEELRSRSRKAIPKKNFKQNLLASMENGDMLISSSFLGGKAMAKFKYPLFYLLNAEIKAKTERIVTNRTMVMKKSSDEAIVTWENVGDSNIELSAGLSVLLLKFPLIKANIRNLNKVDRSYSFDLNKPTELKLVANSINKMLPTQADFPEANKFRVDKLQMNELGLMATFFNISDAVNVRQRRIVAETDFTDPQKKDKTILVFEKTEKVISKVGLLPVSRDIYTTKAIFDQDENLYASFKFDFTLPGATRDKFLKFYERNINLFPKDLVTFDISTINYYVGDVTMSSEVILSDEGIYELFGPDEDGNVKTKNDICLIYAKVNEVENDNTQWCEKLVDGDIFTVAKGNHPLAAKAFIRAFIRAQKTYQEIADEIGITKGKKRRKAFKLLRKIVSVLNKTNKYRRTLDVLLEYVSDDNYYRNALIDVTRLRSMTGRNYEVEISDHSNGNFAPIKEYLGSNPSSYLDNVLTIVLDTLGNLYANPILIKTK